MFRQLSFLAPVNKDECQHELVYRVSDAKNPLTGFPTPQEDTFSLEFASLLFNILGWSPYAQEISEEGSPNLEDSEHYA